MKLVEKNILIPAAPGHRNLIAHIQKAVELRLGDGAVPVRFATTRMDETHYQCELGLLKGGDLYGAENLESIFRFVPRKVERTDSFNAVFLIPTSPATSCDNGSAGCWPAWPPTRTWTH